MRDILISCNQQLIDLPCCHKNSLQNDCNCYNCLHDGFYAQKDSYECLKKLCYYVVNYGPSYSSEVYHYLSTSQLLEKKFKRKTSIKVLSLGCGFAPDLIALRKYISDRELPIKLSYHGIDQAEFWTNIRKKHSNVKFFEQDLLEGFDLSSYDIVFLIKVYSTLMKSKLDSKFLSVLKQQIQTTLAHDSFLIFNDINHRDMGRDVFHNSVKDLFRDYRQFYCDSPPYHEANWIKIPNVNVVYKIPAELTISPLLTVGKTVFFEYRK